MKHIATLIFTLLAVGTLSLTAQERHIPDNSEALSVPEGVERGQLSPRSALLCYPSTAQMEAAGSSDLITPLTAWHKEENSKGMSYSTRFKRNYKLDDKEVILRIEGANGAVSVSVNDKEVGYASSAAGRTEFDLTKALQPNNNTITITVWNNYAAREIEPTGTPSELGFRKAMILTPPRVAIADFAAKTEINQKGDGILRLDVVMQSFLLNSKVYEVYYELYSPDGVRVASGNKDLTTRMLSRDTVDFYARIPEVKAWSPEEPNLYKVVAYTKHQKRIREVTSATIGFRTAELDEKGDLVINGLPVEIKRYSLGKTLENPTAEAIGTIKEEGYNLICTLRPQSDEFYTLCDQLGMMVCSAADITTPGKDFKDSASNNPRWKSAYLWRTMDAYHSTKLHPSVVMFGLGHDAQNGICLYESYLAMKALDNESRPIVYPDANGEWNSDM